MKNHILILSALALTGSLITTPVSASVSLVPDSYAAAFKGSVSEAPALLSESEMAATEGEWGWTTILATILIRTVMPSHAPSPPKIPGPASGGCHHTITGSCTVNPLY